MKPRAAVIRLAPTHAYSGQRLALSALATVCGAGILCCAWLAGGLGAWVWGPGLAAALGLGTTYAPIQAGAWSLLIGGWVAVVPSGFSWWALPAALLALVAHLTAVLTVGLPRRLVWPRAILLRQLRRVHIAAAATCGVAVLTWAVDQRRPDGTVLVALPALLAIASWTWMVRDHDTPASPRSGRRS